MTYQITIKEEPDELVALVRERVRPDEMSEVFPEAFGRLMSCVGPTGYGQGMPGLVMRGMHEPDVADIEVFVPVAHSFDAPYGVMITTLPGGTMATTVHVGPYEDSGPAYAALTEWIDEHGRQIIGPPRELYLNDPNQVGMEHAETRIEFPVA